MRFANFTLFILEYFISFLTALENHRKKSTFRVKPLMTSKQGGKSKL